MKTRPFSIFLLKSEYDPASALNEDHDLDLVENAENLPEGAILYLLDSAPKFPWWRGYFGIQSEIRQATKGALLFLPSGDRWFALSFGFVFHHLNGYSYEYDFGLLVTLNSLDPSELKSADMMEPGAARRKRTQVPVSSDLTYLDFDSNSQIIKSLTGKVRAQYRELFKNATGGASLKVSLKKEPDDLAELCGNLLDLYNSEDYEVNFPNIQNIAPIKDPAEVDRLNGRLVEAMQARDEDLALTIPDIVDYRDNTCCIFNADGHESDVYPDINLSEFFDFLEELGEDVNITIDNLKSFKMLLSNTDGYTSKSYSIYRCLVFEYADQDDEVVYHLAEGNWYKVEMAYIQKLSTYLDEKCEPTDLDAYNHDATQNGKPVYSEANYNSYIPGWNTQYICLDQCDISPSGSTNVEPCDLYCVMGDEPAGARAHLYHIKISTRSAQLSHLFNQGINSVELIELEAEAKAKMKELIETRIGPNDLDAYLRPIEEEHFKVVYGVITHKNPDGLSSNLPLFSKISLMRTMQQLDLMKVKSAIQYIPDQSPKKEGHKKYDTVMAEIAEGADGEKIVCLVEGGTINLGKIIKRCPKQVKESAVGTRYNVSVRQTDEGTLNSYHKWPYSAV